MGVPIVSYPLYRNNRSCVMDVMDRPKINKERTEDNLGVMEIPKIIEQR